MPWHTHDEPLKVQNEKAKKIPMAFIASGEFGEEMFERQRGDEKDKWDYYHEIKRGHDVMITAPKELSEVIQSMIRENRR